MVGAEVLFPKEEGAQIKRFSLRERGIFSGGGSGFPMKLLRLRPDHGEATLLGLRHFTSTDHGSLTGLLNFVGRQVDRSRDFRLA